MAYTKTNWQTGDVITAEKLNHIEQGIGNSNPIMFINSESEPNSPITATWQEVSDALTSGKIVIGLFSNVGDGYVTTTYNVILQTRSGNGNYYADAITVNLLDGSLAPSMFYAESADGILDNY